MRNNLPKRVYKIECAIINLDSVDGPGTHWVAYYKNNKNVYYFDSFGNLPPPLELVYYLGGDTKIFYNHKNYQKFDTVICGQLCIKFLYNFEIKKKYIINTHT